MPSSYTISKYLNVTSVGNASVNSTSFKYMSDKFCIVNVYAKSSPADIVVPVGILAVCATLIPGLFIVTDTSSMVVEYKFTITNEGGIAGYVKKLADYLPEELKFNSELNKDWYEGKDGVIYNASLANTIINPGESKEVTLILTKNMNGDDDFGLINNSAEIYETSNDYGALDIDSTPGNKATNEDDYSTANVLTSVKTGDIVIYTTLIVTIIAIVGVGIYMIKKKVLI